MIAPKEFKPRVAHEGVQEVPERRYVILDKRVSMGYYSYMLILYDLAENNEIISVAYGDMDYWGYANEQKNFREAYEELKREIQSLGIDIDFANVPIEYCGWYTEKACYEIIDEYKKAWTGLL